jgi:hypothetical protein
MNGLGLGTMRDWLTQTVGLVVSRGAALRTCRDRRDDRELTEAQGGALHGGRPRGLRRFKPLLQQIESYPVRSGLYRFTEATLSGAPWRRSSTFPICAIAASARLFWRKPRKLDAQPFHRSSSGGMALMCRHTGGVRNKVHESL